MHFNVRKLLPCTSLPPILSVIPFYANFIWRLEVNRHYILRGNIRQVVLTIQQLHLQTYQDIQLKVKQGFRQVTVILMAVILRKRRTILLSWPLHPVVADGGTCCRAALPRPQRCMGRSSRYGGRNNDNRDASRWKLIYLHYCCSLNFWFLSVCSQWKAL
jgi:hypothetical protein